MIDVSAYCRDVEAYLCQRNGGHLIRVVGPAFDLVKGWADLGIPLSVVHDAIDRTVERAERTRRRRRPIPIAFCEGDVLDGFDRWRRAVGVGVQQDSTPASAQRRGTLAAHVERVSAHLQAWLQPAASDAPLRPHVQAAADALTELAAPSVTARGAARDALLARLAALDAALVDAAAASLPAERLEAMTREAEQELEGFRSRLDEPQWAAAVATARARAIRRDAGLPPLGFD
jgi:hypothetical protein